MSTIVIDRKKCIACGQCTKVCPTQSLYSENNEPRILDNGCIVCGHCYAICPSSAISMPEYDGCDGEQMGSFAQFDEDEMLLAMKSRRSIRHFKTLPVTEDQIQKIIEAGRYAPTATNMQNISYTIITGEKMAKVEKECVALFRKALNFLGLFSSAARHREIDDHFFFFHAPAAILVSTKKSATDAFGTDINGGLASAYMEIEAESMGLGVLYSGFTVINARLNRKVQKLLKLKRNERPVACLVIGYPDIHFRRIPPRKKAVIDRPE